MSHFATAVVVVYFALPQCPPVQSRIEWHGAYGYIDGDPDLVVFRGYGRQELTWSSGAFGSVDLGSIPPCKRSENDIRPPFGGHIQCGRVNAIRLKRDKRTHRHALHHRKMKRNVKRSGSLFQKDSRPLFLL